MKTKKILYFCSSYPYPIDDGIKKINVNLINEFIFQGHEVTLVIPDECDIIPDYFSKIKIIKYNKKRTITKLFRSLFLLEPLYFGLYYDKSVFKKIRKEDYDLVFYDFYPLTQYSSGMKNEIFMMPDSMKQLAWSGFKNEKGILRKTYLFINYLLANIYNNKIQNIKKLYVSNEDIKIDKLQNSFFFKIPADNYDFKKYQQNNFNKNEILFRGIMNFEPNITAVKNFYNDIFIDLIKKYPNINLKIVGKNPSDKLKNKLEINCTFTGFVDDIFDEMSKSAFHIVPMTSGTGVKTKMLDSISLKRLVLATPKAINGIFNSVEEARENGIIVYEDKEYFFDFFDKIIENKFDYNGMVDKAYNYLMKNNYNKKIDELFNIASKEIN